MKLQREMKLLKQENRFLRDELEFPHREKPRFPIPNTADGFQKRILNGKHVEVTNVCYFVELLIYLSENYLFIL